MAAAVAVDLPLDDQAQAHLVGHRQVKQGDLRAELVGHHPLRADDDDGATALLVAEGDLAQAAHQTRLLQVGVEVAQQVDRLQLRRPDVLQGLGRLAGREHRRVAGLAPVQPLGHRPGEERQI